MKNKDVKYFLYLAVIIMLILSLSGCADVVDVDECIPAPLYSHQYGFWGGLWHGFVIFFSFIGNLFSDDIAVYAINNNGGWYNFGYFLGATGSWASFFNFIIRSIGVFILNR